MDNPDKLIVGAQEQISLPDLGIDTILAKIDSGADTSCLHAFDIHKVKKGRIRFKIHPEWGNHKLILKCEADYIARRRIKSSNGESQSRYVIETTLVIGERVLTIELTLANRDQMGFRMLLGKQALRQGFLIDVNK